MRIALVTPYSWTYPGGVNRHVESLAEEFIGRGHHVRVLAPWDPDDRISRLMHRRAPEARKMEDYLVPLGRTVGFPANGAVSNLCLSPTAVSAMRRELRHGGYDVVHVHEPVAPALSWDAILYDHGSPVVGTFHAYSTKALPNNLATLAGARRVLNRLHARIAVSEAAEWTGRRFFGGEYTVVPNGVDVDAAPSSPKPQRQELRVLFVGRPEERKGLPVLLNAFAGLVDHLPARLTVIGSDREDVDRYLSDPSAGRHVEALGSVDEDRLWRELHDADVLCAPSLSGESFGMVLTEAFAAGTPVIASAIAGYSDVVTDGVDGLLVPPADPQALAEALQSLHAEPERRRAMGLAARDSAQRYAWPRVADSVLDVYERARAVPHPASARQRLVQRVGLAPRGGGPRQPPRRLASVDPEPVRRRRLPAARKLGLAMVGAAAVGLTLLAAQRIGVSSVADAFLRSSPTWVLIAIALMMLSLFFRAGSWHAAIRAALPDSPVRRRDVSGATMIGVLMSATLPARLGEPARAMVMARRVGRMRDNFPVLLGTLVSQTVMNVIALILLGLIVVATSDLFQQSQKALFVVSLAPALLLAGVLGAPALMRGNGAGRVSRAIATVQSSLLRVRSGLRVLADPRRGPLAVGLQLTAWAIQVLACYALFVAMGLDAQVGIGAAAAVLFAVNVTAVLPATPSNIGVFQLAVMSVLTAGYGVGAAEALGYGLILQAVEIATAVALGVPSLVREGMSWSDMRLRAMHASSVQLSPRTREGAREPTI